MRWTTHMASIPRTLGGCYHMPSFEGRFGSIRHGPPALAGAPIHEPIVARMQRAAETPFRRDAAVTYVSPSLRTELFVPRAVSDVPDRDPVLHPIVGVL